MKRKMIIYLNSYGLISMILFLVNDFCELHNKYFELLGICGFGVIAYSYYQTYKNNKLSTEKIEPNENIKN